MINIKILYDELVSYILYLNNSVFIKEMVLTNTGEDDIEDVCVKVRFNDDIAEDWEQKNITLEAHKSTRIDFEKKKISFIGKKLYEKTESFQTSFSIVVMKNDNILLNEIRDFTSLTYNQWLGANYQPSLIASFVVPNHPKINSIIKRASQFLKDWNVSFSDYQTQDKTDVLSQIKAIYLAIQQENLSYITAPPSFEDSGQRVRLANEVIEQKMGNCIELSLLFISCLEYVRLNAFLVLINGHAFVGCWLNDGMFPYAVNDDLSLLKIRLSSGIEDLAIVESTCLTSIETVDFEVAQQLAFSKLDDESQFLYTLDIKKARLLGVRPIPQEAEILQVQNEVEETFTELTAEKPKKVDELEDIEFVTKRHRSKLESWESKLLNLTLRNNLLNFRPHKRSITIMEGDLDLLENNLATGKEFALVPCPDEMDVENRAKKEYSYTLLPRSVYKNYTNQELNNNRLVTLMNSRDLDYAIKALYYTSRTELEENGANTLYIALGFLKWYESDISKMDRYAPILLCPVELIRKSSIKGYVVRFRDEEVQVNTTLLEKLRIDLNIEIPDLDELPTDESGVDVKKILNIFRKAVIDKKNWDVVDRSYISLFSFNEFVMWNDLHSRGEQILNNEIVMGLVNGVYTSKHGEIMNPYEIDNTDDIVKSAILMDADSSQLSAIYSSAKDNSFVLHGPPGTGKSQTITNIIATALYQGKSVLFVAEKMAALNVVQSRLKKIGIQDFVLELHSNKSRKTVVLENLGKTLELNRNGEIKDIEDKRKKLVKHRDEIRNINHALHHSLDCGYSIFDMISFYEKEYMVKTGNIDARLLHKVSPEYVELLETSIKKYLLAYNGVDDVLNHPLKRIHLIQLSLKERETLKENIINFWDLLNKFKGSVELSYIMKHVQDLTINNVKCINGIAEKLCAYHSILTYFIKNFTSELMDEEITNIIHLGKEICIKKSSLLQLYNESILDFDVSSSLLEWNKAKQAWFVPKFLTQNRIAKKVNLYSLNGKVEKQLIYTHLTILDDIKKMEKNIDQFMEINGYKYREIFKSKQTNWDEFDNAVANTREVCDLLLDADNRLVDVDIKQFISTTIDDLISFRHNNEDIIADIAQVVNVVCASNEALSKSINNTFIHVEEHLNTELKIIERMNNEFQLIDKWVEYFRAKQFFTDELLTAFIDDVEFGRISTMELHASIMKSLMYYKVIDELEENPYLKDYSSNEFSVLVDMYRVELELVTKMTKYELKEKLLSKIPRPKIDININSELGILKKAVKSGGRGISLRKVFDSAPNVIRSIAPCMLMSPMSIAQYIDPDFPKFDLVVFDEASQVCTHSAIGAISRGSQLIVVGDPNQLPPTSFFKGNYEDDEASFEEIDQASVLDECQAISFPELHLNWHYRSKHESLIAFSNSQYYENSLFTFPSVNDQISKVNLIEIEGFYDRGDTKENTAEADAIISEIKRRLSSSELRKHSIGVVTFSSVQQRLIQNKLEEMFTKNPKLETIANEMEEEIFVKNLENVQGDERDVILFSIGYGPDKQGKVTMNFGPLNQDEGWKRLNVVVSRSREEMLVYSVLKSEHIDLSRTSSKGVYGLKKFLEFARNRNSLAVDSGQSVSINDEITNAIERTLIEKGYSVNKNIGRSNYRIDLGIINHDNGDEYLAAILIDGINGNKTPTVRDKIVVQPSVLKNLGWNLIEVKTIDWFKNKNIVIEEIEKQLESIKLVKKGNDAYVDEKVVIDIADEIEFVKPLEKEIAYYERFNMDMYTYTKDEFYEHDASNKILDLMNSIVQFEAPIVEEDLFRRIMGAFDFTQLGSRIKGTLEQIAYSCACFKIIDDHQTTYWLSEEQHDTYKIYRACNGERRQFNFICDDEICNTIEDILRDQVSLDFTNLCKEVFKIHGYKLLGDESKEIINRCLGILCYYERVQEENDRFLLGCNAN